MSALPGKIDLFAVRDRHRKLEDLSEPSKTGLKGTVWVSAVALAANLSAADVPDLIEEIERLRREVETVRAIAQGNKRHVAESVAILDRVEALTKDSDGREVDAAQMVIVGQIRRALHEPVPSITGSSPSTEGSPCG